MPYSPYLPPPPPTISTDVVSVSAFLSNLTRVTRVINDLTAQRFFSDRMLAAGPNVPSGAIIYDQVTGADLYLDTDVEEIRPGANFPNLTDSAPTPKTAAVAKYGGEVTITREDINRNRWDVVLRELTKLRNTVIRKVDGVSLAAVDAAPVQTQSGVDLTSATSAQIIAMLAAGKGLIDNLDMGYDADLWLLNPTNADELVANENLLKILQSDGPGFGGGAPLRTGFLGRILDMDVVKSNRVPAGTGRIVASGIVGGLSQEEGQGVLTNTYTVQGSGPGDTHVQAWRPLVPYITDPKAVVNQTGL